MISLQLAIHVLQVATVNPEKRSRREVPVCEIRDSVKVRRSSSPEDSTASCRRSGDRLPSFSATQLSDQSSSSHASQRLPPFGHRRVEEPRSGQLWRDASRLWVHEEGELTRRKPQQSEDTTGVPRQNPRWCCAEGPRTSPEAEDPRLRHQLLDEEVSAHQPVENVFEAAASLIRSRGGIQAARCPPCFKTRLPGVNRVKAAGSPSLKKRQPPFRSQCKATITAVPS